MDVLDSSNSDVEYRTYMILERFPLGLKISDLTSLMKKKSSFFKGVISLLIQKGYVRREKDTFFSVRTLRRKKELLLSYSEQIFELWICTFPEDTQKEFRTIFKLIGYNLKNNAYVQKNIDEIMQNSYEKIIVGTHEFYKGVISGNEKYLNLGRLKGYIKNTVITVSVSTSILCPNCGKDTWRNDPYCKHCNTYFGDNYEN